MMPSHLTRRVFRRLLSNRPLVTHRQLHRATRPLLRSGHARAAFRPVPARTFFEALFGPQKPDPRSPNLDPGMPKMLDLDKRIHLVARLPPQEELVKAFNQFIQRVTEQKRPIEDIHATQLLQTLETLEKRHDPVESPSLDRASIKTALQSMAVEPLEGYSEVHNKLVRAMWTAIQGRTNEAQTAETQERSGVPVALIKILCTTGDTAEARDMLESLGEPSVNHKGPRAASWAIVLEGFSKQNDEREVAETVKRMERLNVHFSTNVARTLAVHFARLDNVEETKKWYSKVYMGGPVTANSGNKFAQDETVYQTLLEFCLRNDEMAWGRKVLTPTEGKKSSFNQWDAIFRASAATGRSVDEIDRMMAVMARRADESGQDELRPNIDTFNGLIRYALAQNNAYLAERYFGLMDKWEVEPSSETYCLQVEYRLAAADLDGALASYASLRREMESGDIKAWRVMNKLLQALAAKPGIEHDAVANILEDIVETRLSVTPQTTLALTSYYLRRDDYLETVNLLNSLCWQLSTSERIQIRDMMVDYAFDPKTDTGRAWETYMIFHQVFKLETGRDIFTGAMRLFFSRRRPDLATHVFMEMNKHDRADTRPDVNTYIDALEGIAATADTDALEIIHNLLKLDTNVEPCTRLYNCLMIAYTACQRPLKALDFWHEISISAEGPSYNSLKIAFRACERIPFGYSTARKIWEKLKQANIEIDKSLFTCYISCASRQRMFEDIYNEMKGMKELTGEEPDVNTIGSMFNATTGQTTQMVLEKYFRENYPQLWAELEAKGFDEDHRGWFKARDIKRTLET